MFVTLEMLWQYELEHVKWQTCIGNWSLLRILFVEDCFLLFTLFSSIVYADIVLTPWILLSDGVGGKTEQDNHEDVDSLPSQELKKLANGNNKVWSTLQDAALFVVDMAP